MSSMTLQFEVGEMEPIKVVARYANGTVIKGFTQDFFPNKDRFHVIPADRRPGETIEVFMNRLKAVFTVRDFQGDPYYNEQKAFAGWVSFIRVRSKTAGELSRSRRSDEQ
jgi:hypothetical protein